MCFSHIHILKTYCILYFNGVCASEYMAHATIGSVNEQNFFLTCAQHADKNVFKEREKKKKNKTNRGWMNNVCVCVVV